jgi:hypothetical protein
MAEMGIQENYSIDGYIVYISTKTRKGVASVG